MNNEELQAKLEEIVAQHNNVVEEMTKVRANLTALDEARIRLAGQAEILSELIRDDEAEDNEEEPTPAPAVKE